MQAAATPDHTPTRGETEETLIALAAAGDERSFTRLYDAHYDRIYRYVYYRLGRVEESEDLAQQVFLQAWRALPRYRRTETPFLGWLYTIARNATVSFQRSRKFDAQRDCLPDDGAVANDSEAALDARFERERIREAVRRLKPDQQHVIALRFLEGFEYAEIAASLGKSESNVRVIQYRALRRLREILAPDTLADLG